MSTENIVSVSGGKQLDMLRVQNDGPLCSSIYGLCE